MKKNEIYKEFIVDLKDLSYKKCRNIYKIIVGIDNSIPYSPIVYVEAYYKTDKSKNKERCYTCEDTDNFRFKSSYEIFKVKGLTNAVELLKNKIKDE